MSGAANGTATGPLLVGQVLDDKYRIRSEMGSGAIGVVYEAQHLMLDKLVAIKVLRSEWAGDEEVRARFEAEARAVAALGHPNIVAVTDMGRIPAGAVYFVMDRLQGESLWDRLQRKHRLEAEAAATVADEVLAGLEAAHAQGLIHRDLKPDNVFLALGPGGRETAKILDFGVAKIQGQAGGGSLQTQVGAVLGTPEYMPPEQARGGTIDARVDLYAVGVMLYQMLSGRLPYHGNNPVAVLSALLTQPPPPLASVTSGVPSELIALVERAMSRSPAGRPENAAAFREQLRQAFPGHPAPLSVLARRSEVASEYLAGELKVITLGGSAAATPIVQTPPAPDAIAAPVAADPPAPAPAPVRGGPPTAALELARPPRPPASAAAPAAAPLPRPRPRIPRRFPGPAVWLGLAALVGAVALGVHYAGGWRSLLRAEPERENKPINYVSLPHDDAVLITFEIQPRGATLMLDGEPLQSNPARVPRSTQVRRLSAQADGFEPGWLDVVPDRPRLVKLTLKRAR